jgi:capsular exopolysaccharide synthesis family protein
MSYIFDALQRSQMERAEANKTGSAVALELLEHAERETSSQWSSEPAVEQSVGTRPEIDGSLMSDKGFGTSAAVADPAVITEALRVEERRENFSHFQTLSSSYSKDGRLVSLSDAGGPATEAFHLLGVRLRNLQKSQQIKRLLITSTVPQEGKSVIAANVACTLGFGDHQKVLLIDGDMRRPSQSTLFGLAKVPGLSNHLQGKRSLTACIYHVEEAGIWILPAGDNSGGSSELMRSPRLPELMATLSQWFDWVVIDSPPVLPMVDTSVWSRLADGILLVARHGTTKKRKLQKGMEAIDPSKLVGIVLNASTSPIDSDYYYYADQPESSRRSDTDRE